MAYAIHYDELSGEILSIASPDYSSDGDWIVNDLPQDFNVEDFYIYTAIVEGEEYGRYFAVKETGYLYNENGERVVNDENLPGTSELIVEEPAVSDVGNSVSGNGFIINNSGGRANDNTSISGDGIDPRDPLLDDPTSTEDAIDSALSTISADGTVICQLELTVDDWTFFENRYIYIIANDHISLSTVINILAVNRDVLTTDIYWKASNGQFVFTTDEKPSDNVRIFCYLFETRDDWAAQGRIESWPGRNLVSKRYRHTLHKATDSITIGNDISNATTYSEPFPISAGASVNVQTDLDFSDATLLFATPEWTGNTHVIMPHCYVNANHMLCYTLTNLGSSVVSISEVMIRLLYRGRVDGLVTDQEDAGDLPEHYITESDIDELDVEGE